MPIHFSIGFVAENRPRRPITDACAYYPTTGGKRCFCGKCLPRGHICVVRGDDTRIIVSVFNSNKEEFDISGVSEIVFIVADGEKIGGNIGPGGSVLLDKRFTTGEIIKSGNLYQFAVDISNVETSSLPRRTLYYESQLTTSGGLKVTIASGIFNAENTMIRGIV